MALPAGQVLPKKGILPMPESCTSLLPSTQLRLQNTYAWRCALLPLLYVRGSGSFCAALPQAAMCRHSSAWPPSMSTKNMMCWNEPSQGCEHAR